MRPGRRDLCRRRFDEVMGVCVLTTVASSRLGDCLPRLLRGGSGFDLVLGFDTPADERLAMSLFPSAAGVRRVVFSEIAPWAPLDSHVSLNLKQLLMVRWAHDMGLWSAAVTVEMDDSFLPCEGLEGRLAAKAAQRIVWGADIDGQGQYVTGSCQGLFVDAEMSALWGLFSHCRVYTHNADLQLWDLADVPEFMEAVGLGDIKAGLERLNWYTFPHVAYGMFQVLRRGYRLVVVNRGGVVLPHYDFVIYGLEHKDRWLLSQLPASFMPMQVMKKYHEQCPEMAGVWVLNHHDRK